MEARYKKELKNLGKSYAGYVNNIIILTRPEIRSGIDRTDISKIENGLKNIELRTIIKTSQQVKYKNRGIF